MKKELAEEHVEYTTLENLAKLKPKQNVDPFWIRIPSVHVSAKLVMLVS